MLNLILLVCICIPICTRDQYRSADYVSYCYRNEIGHPNLFPGNVHSQEFAKGNEVHVCNAMLKPRKNKEHDGEPHCQYFAGYVFCSCLHPYGKYYKHVAEYASYDCLRKGKG